MESEDIEKETKQSAYNWLDKGIEIAIVALAGITTTIFGNSLSISEIILAWAFAIIGILIVIYCKLWFSHKKLLSDDASKRRVKELFLKQLIGTETICGNDLLINETGRRWYSLTLGKGWAIEVLVFSQKKFNFALLNKTEYGAFKTEVEKINDVSVNNAILEKLKIDAMCMENISYFKSRIIIPDFDLYTFYFTKADKSDKCDVEINLTISNIPLNGIARNNIPMVREGNG